MSRLLKKECKNYNELGLKIRTKTKKARCVIIQEIIKNKKQKTPFQMHGLLMSVDNRKIKFSYN